MSMKLPAFDGLYCQAITVCGKVMGSRDFSSEKLLKKKTLATAYKTGKEKIFLQVYGGGKKDKHVHINIVNAVCFGGRGPKPTHKRADIQSVFDQLIGKKIEVGIKAGFVLPIIKLPVDGLIRSLSLQKTYGKVGLRMTGGTVSIEGAPVQKMDWEITDDEKGIFISLSGERTVTAGKEYLIESLKWIESIFKVFVLEKESNE